MAATFAKGIRWDLSDLYASKEDPKIQSDLEQARQMAVQFESVYKPAMADLNKNSNLDLKKLINDLELVFTLTTKVAVFAHLSFSLETNNPSIGAFLHKIQDAITEIHNHIRFFEVQWNRIPRETAEYFLQQPSIRSYEHYLNQLRAFAPHTLTEGEENIMAIKSITSGGAFSRLFDEVVNNIPFYIQIKKKKVKRTESEILSLLHSENRSERKRAAQSLADGLEMNTHVITYIYNMILADHRSSMKIRNFKHPMDAMNLSNEIEREAVMNLIQSVKNAYPLAMRYYRLKKKLLKVDRLYDYDRYAPIGPAERKVAFDECRSIILKGYSDFSEEASSIVTQFFEKGWIDAEIREGKQGGGFCASSTPDLHPYILVNYSGSLRDVLVLAHELGHGIHQFLAAKRVGILESSAPLTLAETASVFGEMLIFERLLQDESDREKRLALITGKIDDNFATVFRQVAMTDYELMAHEAGLGEGELRSEQLSDFWMEANYRLYGDSVELTDAYRHGWKYIPHFIHTPFYCYAYAFAQLFVLSLYEQYKKSGASFVPKYLEMLALGGSRRPEEVAAIGGLDIRNPDFWKSGLNLLEKLVTEAEYLAAQKD